MASTYGYNFGFRVSNESYRSGNVGDFKVPDDAEDWLQGEVVEIDPDNQGFLKKSDAGPVAPGYRGIIVQEEAFIFGEHENQTLTTMDLQKIFPGRRASIWTGAGVVFWLKNTPEVKRAGARTRPAVARFSGTPAVGEYLGWDGTKFTVGGAEGTAIAQITEASEDGKYLEATMLR